MKKLLSIIVISIIACTALSATERLFSFSAGLSSGVPIYGSNSAVSTSRMFLGINGTVNINPIKQISFYFVCFLISGQYFYVRTRSEKTYLTTSLKSKIR